MCVHGTCYHNYKGLILVWSLRHDLYCGEVGRSRVEGRPRPTYDPLGGRVRVWRGTPAGVVASVAACVPIVSRYNERVCLTRLGRGVILCLPCVCSPNNCRCTAPHRIASNRAAPHRTASIPLEPSTDMWQV